MNRPFRVAPVRYSPERSSPPCPQWVGRRRGRQRDPWLSGGSRPVHLTPPGTGHCAPVGVLSISPTGGWSRMDLDGF
jgi:hypothetical protein